MAHKHLSHEPQYEWSFDSAGKPVHVTQAARGEVYFCPVCQGRMIAKLGEIKQHHFAHEQIRYCEPKEVARLAAGLWLAEQLQECLTTGRALVMSWPCPLCQQVHTANLLHDMAAVHVDYAAGELALDVALLDDRQQPRAALFLTRPPTETLLACAQRSITALVIDLEGSRDRLRDLVTLLAGARIYGGVCSTQQIAARTGVITDPAQLRDALTRAVAQPPYRLSGPLVQYQGMTHVFMLGDKRLWLPPILWQRAIGGLRNAINPTLHVISQEWPQDDGAVIALYYITARDTYAIAARRFPPGQAPYARLDPSALRASSLEAANVARSFAEL
jgi:hypothetical protein